MTYKSKRLVAMLVDMFRMASIFPRPKAEASEVLKPARKSWAATLSYCAPLRIPKSTKLTSSVSASWKTLLARGMNEASYHGHLEGGIVCVHNQAMRLRAA